MSKTDKTTPVWVSEIQDKPEWFIYEVHDHSRGECDIDKDDPRNWRTQRPYSHCYVTWNTNEWRRFFGKPKFYQELANGCERSKRREVKNKLSKIKYDIEYEEDMTLPSEKSGSEWWD